MRIGSGLFWLVIALALLFIALYFANTKPSLKKVEDSHDHTTTSDFSLNFDSIIKASVAVLSAAEKEKIGAFSKNVEANQANYDSLIAFWDAKKMPVIASYYTEQLANKKNTSGYYTTSGLRYYRAVGFAKEDMRPALYSSAIRILNKAIELNPNNLEAKTGLGVCYVESTPEPMKGITLLREVVQQDSTFIDAHINLGLFAVKSGQFDKAIDRFNKVLKINAEYLEAYLYLADCYEQVGNKKEAIFALENYKNRVNDITIKNEIENYINKLKNS
ncbi:MAG: tetratricopeptide repeat protein [Bacteroidetes bacterium]|nr:tetratricopeptide repeat protein [Bacteroidota bacterium]